jgi:voltage-gated potassium channel
VPVGERRPVLSRSHPEREILADELLDRLTPAMSTLGVVFVLVVLGEQLTDPGSSMSGVLTVVSWLLWLVFVVEFLGRMIVAPDDGRFLRHNWWQIAFLVLPFLRVFRLVRAVRFLRTGRVLSGVVRGSRSAGQVLRGRLGWLGALWLITVLAASELLYSFSHFSSFAEVLHATALASITGEPLGQHDAFAQVTEVVLAAFSIVVFGTLAGTLGAFFLQGQQDAAKDADGPGQSAVGP